jgi:2-C-methyl-D-erythritol 4-phosphate cytidylyltransferase
MLRKSSSAIIVAGGMGKRLGKEIPKAFVPIGDKELFMYSAEVFDEMRIFSEIIIVVPETAIRETQEKTKHFSTKTIVVAGGKERHNSVENGVNSASGEMVLIHDAARPFITKDLVRDLIENYENSNFSGVISANPVVDTIRKFSENLCGETINRDELIAVGTPQIFDKKILLNCFSKIGELDKIPTDEAMLAQNFGYKVGWLKGSKLNFKLTTPEDIILAEAIVKTGFCNE